jgi:hypothetical protein
MIELTKITKLTTKKQIKFSLNHLSKPSKNKNSKQITI